MIKKKDLKEKITIKKMRINFFLKKMNNFGLKC